MRKPAHHHKDDRKLVPGNGPMINSPSDTLIQHQVLGPYRIKRKLGAGGMGEVYQAVDTRLERKVAIKILPPEALRDADKVERFQREARAISSLSHPRICPLFDIGHEDGKDFLVMELVEGQTLEERLKRGPLPLEQALEYAAQIADALAAAHQRGIVHRDLKPGNIMLTTSGVKLLDFGLAKLQEPEPREDRRGSDADKTLTSTGAIMGTFPYMSPEQAEGKPVDSRSDIFSFGAVLYEMLTGQRAFRGESPASLIIAVLQTEPVAISSLMTFQRPGLERIVAKCLAKEVERRWQSAADLRDALRWAIDELAPQPYSAARQPPAPLTLAAGILLALLAGAGAVWWWSDAEPDSPPPTWVEIAPPEGLREVDVPTLSPSGRQLVFEAVDQEGRQQLWLRSLGSREARRLPGTEGASQAFFSPDGRSLGFFAAGALRRLDLEEGHVTVLYEGVGFGASGSWEGDQILFTPNIQDGLLRISASGGTAVQVTTTDLSGGVFGHVWPRLLPDGRRFLFVQHVGEQAGIHAGSLDSDSTRVILPFDRITSTGIELVNEHLVFLRGGVLFAQRFDEQTLELKGEPMRMLDGVSSFGPGFAGFSVSRNGHLVYRRDAGWPTSQVVWLDLSGREIETVGPPGPYFDLRMQSSRPVLSSSGRWLGLSRRPPGEDPQIWLLDMQRQTMLPFITNGYSTSVVFGPDDKTIIYGKVLREPPALYFRPLDGSVPEAPLLPTSSGLPPERWPSDSSASGRYLLFSEQLPDTGWDVHVVDLHSDPIETRPYTQDRAHNQLGKFSPDERWIAFASTLSGQYEMYISRFPTRSRPIQISNGIGGEAFWAMDGSAIYYPGRDGTLMRVSMLESEDEPVLSEPEPVFNAPGLRAIGVSPTGERFLALRMITEPTVQPYVLILNWASQLE